MSEFFNSNYFSMSFVLNSGRKIYSHMVHIASPLDIYLEFTGNIMGVKEVYRNAIGQAKLLADDGQVYLIEIDGLNFKKEVSKIRNKEMEDWQILKIPKFRVIAQFRSILENTVEFESSLVLIWFTDILPPEMDNYNLLNIQSLDWDKRSAKGFFCKDCEDFDLGKCRTCKGFGCSSCQWSGKCPTCNGVGGIWE
jgi:hypothetical protein